MRVVSVTTPVLEPISLEELGLQAKLDGWPLPSVEDPLLTRNIVASRLHVEAITRRKVLTQTWDYSLEQWPSINSIKIPFGNLQSVTSVKWKDTDGAETTLTANTDYIVETNGEACGRIVLPYLGTWPTGTLYPSKPITIRFVCGWTTAALVPDTIKVAMLLICSDFYQNREGTVLTTIGGQSYVKNPAVNDMLINFKLWDEF